MGQISKKRIFFNSVILVIVLGTLYLFISKYLEKAKSAKTAAALTAPAGPKMATAVEGFLAKSSLLVDNVDLPGQILPNEEVEIRPEINGKITTLNIKEGGLVAKGALIVKIFDADIKAQLNKLNVQLDLAQKTQERLKQLLTINGASQQDYDNAVAQVNNTKADIEIWKVNLAKTEIRAPFSGKLGLKSVSTGAYVTPAMVLTVLQQLDPCKLEFSVPDKYLSQIKVSEKVTFIVDGHAKPNQSTIYAIDTKADPTTRNIKIRATVPNASGALSPGTFAVVKLSLKESNALMVPSQSIIPEAKSKKLLVFRSGTASMVSVQTGIRTANMVQVVSGLSAGDTVITTGLLSLKPGMPVKIKSIKSID